MRLQVQVQIVRIKAPTSHKAALSQIESIVWFMITFIVMLFGNC